MNSVFVLWPIIAALSAATTTFLDTTTPWITQNPMQEKLIKLSEKSLLAQEYKNFNDKELKSIVSLNVEDINTFLTENAFDIALQPSSKPNAFYAASILAIVLKWKHEADETEVFYNEKIYKAVSMNSYFSVFSLPVKDVSASSKEILVVPTDGTDTVYMTAAEKPLDNFFLHDQIMEYVHELSNASRIYYDRAIFPFVSIDQKNSVDWILELARNPKKKQPKMHPDSKYVLTQALQQTKFKMDNYGAKVQSAFACAFEEELMSGPDWQEPLTFVLDKPFYIWIVRQGTSIPIFEAYIDETGWVQFE